MKNALFIAVVMCITFTVNAQSKKEQAIIDQFWKTTNKEAKIIDVPEKWSGESSVILYKNIFYGYTNNGKKMYSPYYKHYRIKLQDQAAIDDYSSLSFGKDQSAPFSLFKKFSKEKNTVGIKIIKSDGTENIIDLDKEVITQDEENKVAIPGLEIGDILDFFIYEDDFRRSVSGTFIYKKVETVLSAKSPIVFSRIAIEVENDYFLNMESYNGAPQIKEEETEKRATKRYVLEARDIEKSNFPRWSYPLVSLPSVKFQVTFALKARNENSATVFLSDDDAERKTNVSKEEILDYYDDRFFTYKKTIKSAVDYIKEAGITDPREQIEKAFYYARFKHLNKFTEIYIASEELSLSAYACDEDYFVLKARNIVGFMSGLAREFGVDYDVVVATARYNGNIDDLLLKSNVSYGIRLNFEKPLYVFDVSSHAQLDRFPSYLEGTKAYIMSVKKAKKIEGVSTDVLPVSMANDNVSKQVVNVSIENSFKEFKVNRTSEFSGYFKPENLSTYVFFEDYLDEEYERYEAKHFYFCGKKQKKKEIPNEEKLHAAYKTYREINSENLAKRASNDYDADVTDYEYSIKQTSRYSDESLVVEDNFTINDNFVKKAGPNYIVSVGKFIEGQVQLEKEELERDIDAFINYAKTFNYTINIKIPDGYTVVGIDKLKKEEVNSTGSFKSTASIENGVLAFSTSKIYSKKSYTPQEWSDMTKWLNIAYDFSQEKVMFKKI